MGLTRFPPACKLYKQASVMRVLGEKSLAVKDSKKESNTCLEFCRIDSNEFGTMGETGSELRTDLSVNQKLS